MQVFAFEDDGYEAVAVPDGNSLLELLGSAPLPGFALKPFDLVVPDLRMPRWSG